MWAMVFGFHDLGALPRDCSSLPFWRQRLKYGLTQRDREDLRGKEANCGFMRGIGREMER